MLLSLSSPLLGKSQTAVLSCVALGFRLFEGDGRIIAFPVSPLAMLLQACQIIILYDPYLKFSLLRPRCHGFLE